MNRVDYQRYRAEGYNRIPLAREVLADLDTPVSTYLKLARGPYSYLLESVEGGGEVGSLLDDWVAVQNDYSCYPRRTCNRT